MITLKRKTKEYSTEKEATDKQLELLTSTKDDKPEFQSVVFSKEDLIVVSEKIITKEEEKIDDLLVDKVEIHYCYHDEEKRKGCKLEEIKRK